MNAINIVASVHELHNALGAVCFSNFIVAGEFEFSFM